MKKYKVLVLAVSLSLSMHAFAVTDHHKKETREVHVKKLKAGGSSNTVSAINGLKGLSAGVDKRTGGVSLSFPVAAINSPALGGGVFNLSAGYSLNNLDQDNPLTISSHFAYSLASYNPTSGELSFGGSTFYLQDGGQGQADNKGLYSKTPIYHSANTIQILANSQENSKITEIFITTKSGNMIELSLPKNSQFVLVGASTYLVESQVSHPDGYTVYFFYGTPYSSSSEVRLSSVFDSFSNSIMVGTTSEGDNTGTPSAVTWTSTLLGVQAQGGGASSAAQEEVTFNFNPQDALNDHNGLLDSINYSFGEGESSKNYSYQFNYYDTSPSMLIKSIQSPTGAMSYYSYGRLNQKVINTSGVAAVEQLPVVQSVCSKETVGTGVFTRVDYSYGYPVSQEQSAQVSCGEIMTLTNNGINFTNNAPTLNPDEQNNYTGFPLPANSGVDAMYKSDLDTKYNDYTYSTYLKSSSSESSDLGSLYQPSSKYTFSRFNRTFEVSTKAGDVSQHSYMSYATSIDPGEMLSNGTVNVQSLISQNITDTKIIPKSVMDNAGDLLTINVPTVGSNSVKHSLSTKVYSGVDGDVSMRRQIQKSYNSKGMLESSYNPVTGVTTTYTYDSTHVYIAGVPFLIASKVTDIPNFGSFKTVYSYQTYSTANHNSLNYLYADGNTPYSALSVGSAIQPQYKLKSVEEYFKKTASTTPDLGIQFPANSASYQPLKTTTYTYGANLTVTDAKGVVTNYSNLGLLKSESMVLNSPSIYGFKASSTKELGSAKVSTFDKTITLNDTTSKTFSLPSSQASSYGYALSLKDGTYSKTKSLSNVQLSKTSTDLGSPSVTSVYDLYSGLELQSQEEISTDQKEALATSHTTYNDQGEITQQKSLVDGSSNPIALAQYASVKPSVDNGQVARSCSYDPITGALSVNVSNLITGISTAWTSPAGSKFDIPKGDSLSSYCSEFSGSNSKLLELGSVETDLASGLKLSSTSKIETALLSASGAPVFSKTGGLETKIHDVTSTYTYNKYGQVEYIQSPTGVRSYSKVVPLWEDPSLPLWKTKAKKTPSLQGNVVSLSAGYDVYPSSGAYSSKGVNVSIEETSAKTGKVLKSFQVTLSGSNTSCSTLPLSDACITSLVSDVSDQYNLVENTYNSLGMLISSISASPQSGLPSGVSNLNSSENLSSSNKIKVEYYYNIFGQAVAYTFPFEYVVNKSNGLKSSNQPQKTYHFTSYSPLTGQSVCKAISSSLTDNPCGN